MAIYYDQKKIILDINANIHRNEKSKIDYILESIYSIRKESHEIIIKECLYKDFEGNKNTVCTHECFDYLYKNAVKLGFLATASISDKESLAFLLQYKVPFIKFSCNNFNNHLFGLIPSSIQVIQSITPRNDYFEFVQNDTSRVYMICIPNYPADIADYPIGMSCISDHVIGLGLWHRDTPIIWEKHIKLPENDGLDFAITPFDLNGII